MPKQVLVVGGGFAGLSAVNELARQRSAGLDISVRLVDRQEQSVFLPLLPDLISGRVRPRHICYDLAGHCRRHGADFVQADVKKIDLASRQVHTDRGIQHADAIVLAMGCETNWRGEDRLRPHMLELKCVQDGLRIRQRAWELLQSCQASGRQANIIVIGGGYTGFEIASHLAAMLRRRLKTRFSRLHQAVDITIMEIMPNVLHGVDDALRDWSVKAIKHYGVTVRTGMSVTSFLDERTVMLSDGTKVEDALVIWSAGVSPGPAASGLDAPKVRDGRLQVDTHLRLAGCEGVFAAGDVAGAIKPGAEKPLRMGIQFSLVGGRRAARNLAAGLRGQAMETFDPRDLGYLVPLAPGQAAGIVLGCHMRGRVPYALHYAMCLFRSWNWTNRVGAAIDLVRKRNGYELHPAETGETGTG